MNLRALASLLLKVLAIYILLQMVGSGIALIGAWRTLANLELSSGSGGAGLLFPANFLRVCLVAMVLGYLGSALLFLWKGDRIARWLAPDSECRIGLSGTGDEPVRTLAFQLVGLYALITWLPEWVQTLAQATVAGMLEDPPVPFLWRFVRQGYAVVGPSIGVAIGLALLLRPSGLLRLIQLSRPMARPHATE